MKYNEKLQANHFRVLHLVGKQAYKLELSVKWKIYVVFHVSLLKQDITRRGWLNNKLVPESEFKAKNNKEYKMEII